MAFIDYLLGGVAGGFEGYERKKAKDLQAQKEEEDRQIRQLALLNQLGFRSTGLVRQTPDVAAQDIVGDIAQAVPAKSFDTTVGEAFKAAGERGMGIKPQAPQSFTESQNKAFQAARGRGFGVTTGAPMGGTLGTPVAEALQRGMTTDRTMAAPSAAERKPLLDSSRLDQFERGAAMQPANPEMQVNLPGFGRMGFAPGLTDEQKAAQELAQDIAKYKAQREVLQQEEASDLAKKSAKTKEEQDALTTLISAARKGGAYSDAGRRLLAVKPDVWRAAFPNVDGGGGPAPQRGSVMGEEGILLWTAGGTPSIIPYPAGFTPRSSGFSIGEFLQGGAPGGATPSANVDQPQMIKDSAGKLRLETPAEFKARTGK